MTLALFCWFAFVTVALGLQDTVESLESRMAKPLTIEFKGESTYQALKRVFKLAGVDYVISPLLRVLGSQSSVSTGFVKRPAFEIARAIEPSYFISEESRDTLIACWRVKDGQREMDIEPWIRRPEPERRVALRLENTHWRDGLLRVLDSVDADYALPEGPQADVRVTETFSGEPLAEALNRIIQKLPGGSLMLERCENIYAFYTPGIAAKPSHGLRLRFRFRDADLRYVIRAMMRIYHRNWVIDVGVRGVVNAESRGMPWREVFEAVLRSQSDLLPITYRVEDDVFCILPRREELPPAPPTGS